MTIHGSPRISHEQICSTLRYLEKDNWIHSAYATVLRDGYFQNGPDLAVLLLLSSNPNVRELRILYTQNPIKRVRGGDKVTQLPIYLEALRGPLIAHERLPRWVDNLSTLELNLRDFTWTTITPLLRLPALKKLFIKNGEERSVRHLADAYASVAPRSSSVEVLEFGTCYLTTRTVINAVSVCKALRIFQHQGYVQYEHAEEIGRLNSEFFEQRSTLQTFDTCRWYHRGEPFTTAKLAKEFAALSHLGLHYLVIKDVFLPLNLRSLAIHANSHDTPLILDELAHLAPVLCGKASPGLPIMFRYVYGKNSEYTLLPRLRLWKIPAMFAKEGLDLSLHVSLSTKALCEWHIPAYSCLD
jgi:hypothetical protein